jgi:hypothetical protein
MLALYRQLKLMGAFEGVTDVIELGSQVVRCTERGQLDALFEAFGKPILSDTEIVPFLGTDPPGSAPSRLLHERLGFHYDCIDIDGQSGALALDLNFDAVPTERRGRYGLVTNFGTTEHVFNQQNAFSVIHDFTAAGGLMLHAVPFTVHLEHGFFNYQPNVFTALARYNSYDILGMWVGLDWRLSSLVPWEPQLLDHLHFYAGTTHVLFVALRKTSDVAFRVPLQGVYETMTAPASARRYELPILGKVPQPQLASKSASTDGQQQARVDAVERNALIARIRELEADLQASIDEQQQGRADAAERDALIARICALEANLQARIKSHEEDLRAIYNSSSWRMTASMRKLATWLRNRASRR